VTTPGELWRWHNSARRSASALANQTMSELDVERIAKRLGLTDAVICQLRAHGYLQRLAVTAHELDARIYRAHLAYPQERRQPPSTRTRPNHAGELPAAEMAAHLVETPAIADRVWTDEQRLPRETRTFIRRMPLGETQPVEAPEG
jgi:CubicO group peptidase (beta-lactamase class C family)